MNLPQAFYFTDEQCGIDPLQIAQELPLGCGIIFRHYNNENRKILAFKLSKICKSRGLTLLIAQTPELAQKTKSTGCHVPEYLIPQIPMMKTRYPMLVFTAACHSRRSLYLATKMGADIAFLSPMFATKSHLGKTGLGLMPAALISKNASLPIYALGGVTSQRWRQLSAVGFAGFGGISSLETGEFSRSGLISSR